MVKTLRRKSALGGGGDRGQPWEAGETEVSPGRRGRRRSALGVGGDGGQRWEAAPLSVES